MIAEIHGKISSSGSNLSDRMEDKLIEVNLENANKLVFDEFDKMRNIK